MKAPLKIMVTGAGSGVGQGIIKALRHSGLSVHILAADISPMNQGLYRADSAVLIPRVENSDALPRLLAILRREKPQCLFIGSEFEIAFFAQHREAFEQETNTHICVAPPQTIAIANDKWLTVEHLRAHNLPHALSFLPQSIEQAIEHAAILGYPCILKTRRGTSNRHVHLVQDAGALEEFFPSVPHPMLQKMLAHPSTQLDAEYTCSVFRTAENELLGPFTARRTLRGGNSWCIEVDHFPELTQVLLDIGHSLPFSGSLNIQLMLTSAGPVPFEINARFSGTTAVRAYYGFNEPAMYVRNYIFKDSVEPPSIGRGMSFRYLEEVFVDGLTSAEIDPEHIPRGRVLPWF